MSYALDDFKYSILGGFDRSCKLPSKVKHVHYAYGQIDDDGKCCDECGGEWSGGFVCELEDGQFAHVTGWCDYTGWGCQDGASHTLHKSITEIDINPFWDKDPVDLNQNLASVYSQIEKEEA